MSILARSHGFAEPEGNPALRDSEIDQQKTRPRKCFFFHIPKTAGTSVLSTIREHYQSVYIQKPGDHFTFFDTPYEGFDFISGHFPISKFISFVSDEFYRFAVLRNPLTHLPSQISYIAIKGTVIGFGAAYLVDRARKMGIHDFLKARGDAQFQVLCDNPQTRFILGLFGEPLGSTHVDQAIAALERLDFVGTVESMNYSMQRIGRALYIDGLDRSAPVNTNPRNRFDVNLVDRETLNAVMQSTWFDARVFDHFQQRLLAQEAAEPVPAIFLRRRDSAPEKIFQLTDLFRTADLDVANVIVGEGYQILGENLLLHPPDLGTAVARVINVDLNGIEKITGTMIILGDHSQSVVFALRISIGECDVFSLDVKVERSAPIDIKASFVRLSAPATITLSTRMANENSTNAFAWATFRGFSLFGAV
jgi:hypothetical protein